MLETDGWYVNYPIRSMYGIFTYIRVIFRANVGKYSSTMEHMGMLFFLKVMLKIPKTRTFTTPELPSGKRLHDYGKSLFLLGKSTINGHFP